MISVRDIFELAKFLNKNRIKRIRGYEVFEFASDVCKDHKLLLELNGNDDLDWYSGWNVFIKKSDAAQYSRGSEYSYKEGFPELKEDGWYITDEERTALMEVIADIRHDSNIVFNQLESRWNDSVVDKTPFKLYRVNLYDQMVGHAWIWAQDSNDAYVKARYFENEGMLIAKEFIDSDLEIEEEKDPDDVSSKWILNPEDKNA